MNLTGTVKVEIVIGPDGKVKGTNVVGGHPILVDTTLAALKEWKYEPARTDTSVTLTFDSGPNTPRLRRLGFDAICLTDRRCFPFINPVAHGHKPGQLPGPATIAAWPENVSISRFQALFGVETNRGQGTKTRRAPKQKYVRELSSHGYASLAGANVIPKRYHISHNKYVETMAEMKAQSVGSCLFNVVKRP